MNALIAFLVTFLSLSYITDVFFPFLKQRRLIKMEIDRALDGHEYRHWKRELRRLYIKSAPVIRWFLN